MRMRCMCALVLQASFGRRMMIQRKIEYFFSAFRLFVRAIFNKMVIDLEACTGVIRNERRNKKINPFKHPNFQLMRNTARLPAWI